MSIFSRLVSVTALSAISFFSIAGDFAKSIEVKDGYVREVIPTNKVTSAYMTITNNSSETVKLVGAESRAIPRIEIHEHLMNDGMMQMRQKNYIDIAAGTSAVLQPMGLHLMMFELSEPLKAGQEVEVTLLFEGNKKKVITLPVRSIKKAKTHHHH